MARTVVGLNDPKAVKKFSGALADEVVRDSYFQSRMMSSGAETSTPIRKITDLETEAGHLVSYDLSLNLTGAGIEGLSGDKLEGSEENLSFATSEIYIDQKRHGVNAGTVMTRKRTLHDLRMVAKNALKKWWSELYDEDFMMYSAGARGHNNDFLQPLTYTGRANNPFVAADDEHMMYSGDATAKNNLDATDVMSLTTIDKLVTKSTMMGGGPQRVPKIQPMRINGANKFVLLMSPFDKENVRTSATTGQWLDIQKAAAGSDGQKNPIFTGAMGEYNDTIMHSHQAVVRFNDYGVGAPGTVQASRSCFMGAQAMVCAQGTPGKNMSFDWHEELDDRGNEVIVDTSAIFGIRKNGYVIDGVYRDHGSITVDSAAAPSYA